MAKALRETQVVIRISQPLRDELAAVAAEEGRTLAGYVRRRLVDICARRLRERISENEVADHH
jgi:hypothetical protein